MKREPYRVRYRPSGFTLLELVLTLAVVLVIAAIAIPNVFAILEYRQMVRGANGVRIAMVQARLEAMRSGRTQMMSFQVGGQQFKVEPYVTAEDMTEAADMLGRGTGVMMGGNSMMPLNGSGLGIQSGATGAAESDPLGGRMDQELLPGKAVFGVVQVQATARSATMQQQSSMLNMASSASPSPAALTATGSGDWSQPILFYPDGTTSNAVVSVTLDSTNQIQIKIRGLTGETDVTEVLPL